MPKRAREELSPQLKRVKRKLDAQLKKDEVSLRKILSSHLPDDEKKKLLKLWYIWEETGSETILLTLQNRLDQKERSPAEQNLIKLTVNPKSYADRILELEASQETKLILYQRYQSYLNANDSERATHQAWLDEALSLPYQRLSGQVPLEPEAFYRYLKRFRESLDRELYGLREVKEMLTTFVVNRFTCPKSRGQNLALRGPAGVGKCLGRDTVIRRYNGERTFVQDLTVGDLLTGDDGCPRTIYSITKGSDLLYRVTQSRGISYVVNESHILSLRLIQAPIITYSNERYFLEYVSAQAHHIKSFQNLEECQRHPVMLVGSVIDISLSEYLKRSERWRLSFQGYRVPIHYPFVPTPDDPYNAVSFESCYLINSTQKRLEFLAGLIDRQGLLDLPGAYHLHLDEPHYLPVLDMITSLGFEYRTQPNEIWIKGDIHRIPTRHKKQAPLYKHSILESDLTIEKLDVGDYYGFELDGNGRFLLSDCTVTHNTSVAVALAKALEVPFQNISCAGVSESTLFTGVSFHWSGSQMASTTRCLSRAKVADALIYLDEVDKIGNGDRGVQCQQALLPLLDSSQNHQVRDIFFGDLTQDFSKVWFVLSLNKIEQLDPFLRDRLTFIELKPYTSAEKRAMIRSYLWPKILRDVGLSEKDIMLSESSINFLIQKTTTSIRSLEKALRVLIGKINYNYQINKYGHEDPLLQSDLDVKLTFPLIVEPTLFEKLVLFEPSPILSYYS